MAVDIGAVGFGASEGLQDVLRRLHFEAQLRQQAERDRAMQEAQRRNQEIAVRGQEITTAGQKAAQSRWDTDRIDRQTREMAEGAEAAAGRAREREIRGRLIATNPALGSVFDARDVGMNVSDPHLLEPEDVHAPHVAAANKAKVEQIGAETEAREKAQFKYRAPTPPRDERLVQVEGPDGRPTWVRESQAVGKPAAQAARAVTGQERGVLAYYNRAKDAEDTIGTADASGRSLEDRVAKSGLATQVGLQYMPNMLQTSDQQAYRQAQRAFTEARLRKESGAAIPTAEYENDAKTYFAQPGDGPELIKQKKQKRQTVLEGLKFSSGRAYDEFYGEGKGGAKSDPLGIRK